MNCSSAAAAAAAAVGARRGGGGNGVAWYGGVVASPSDTDAHLLAFELHELAAEVLPPPAWDKDKGRGSDERDEEEDEDDDAAFANRMAAVAREISNRGKLTSVLPEAVPPQAPRHLATAAPSPSPQLAQG